MRWYCMNCMKNLRLHRQRLKGKNFGRNIWTGGGYLRASAGKVSFDDIRHERGTLM